RPASAPNLNAAGLAWLGGTLFISLGLVAVRQPIPDSGPIGPANPVSRQIQKTAADVVEQNVPRDPATLRAWVERGFAGLCHFAVVAALILLGIRHFGDWTAGIAAATMYVLLPYCAFHITQVDYVLPAALVLWAVVLYRSPAVAGALIGI